MTETQRYIICAIGFVIFIMLRLLIWKLPKDKKTIWQLISTAVLVLVLVVLVMNWL